MVDVLTGKINPSGKLAETWANAHADTPAKDNFAGAGRTVQYREGLYVGYRYYQTAGVPVAFPFGYGLSYTSFAYSELKADARSVTLTVTNTGSRAGAEIVQVYVAKPDAEDLPPRAGAEGLCQGAAGGRGEQDRDPDAGRQGVPLLEHQAPTAGRSRAARMSFA